jgi:hypothetical protein
MHVPFWVFCFIVLFCVLFVRKCVLSQDINPTAVYKYIIYLPAWSAHHMSLEVRGPVRKLSSLQSRNTVKAITHDINFKVKFTIEETMNAHRGSISSTLSLTQKLDGGGWLKPHTGRFTPGKTQYLLCWRLGGPQEWPGRVRKISPPPAFDP